MVRINKQPISKTTINSLKENRSILSQKGDRVRREREESHSGERGEKRKGTSPLPLSSLAASRHTLLSSGGDSGRHN